MSQKSVLASCHIRETSGKTVVLRALTKYGLRRHMEKRQVLLWSFFSIVISKMLCNMLMLLIEFFLSCKIHPLFHVVD